MNRQQRRAEKKSGGSSYKVSPVIQRLADEAAHQYQLGRPNEAATCYAKILRIAPFFADAHFNLALMLTESGRLEEAVAQYRRAIELKPDHFGAHNNLGNLLHELKRFDEAAICLRSAISLSPNDAEAYNNLGAILLGQNQPDLAVASFKKAIELRPDLEQAYNNLGLTLRELGRLDEATACFKKLIDISPDQAERHNILGRIFLDQSKLSLAVASFEKAIKLRPDYEHAYNNLGVTLRELGCLDKAIVHLSEAIRLSPHLAEAHSTLGATLAQLGRLDEAVACYRKATEFKPDLADAHHNLAMALLLRSEMAEGWREYEWRWKTPQFAKSRRIFAQPQWRGEPAEERTLLVHAEQGLGDTLQFSRYATLAANRGLRVIMEAPGPLVRLLLSVPGVDRVVARGEPLPSFDLHCPLLSMPLALGTVLATIPALPGYLQADPAQAEAWRLRLAAATEPRPRVGLVWAGSSMLKTDGRRSIAPTQLTALFNVPGLHFFSLQKGGPVAPEAFKLVDFMGEMDDFADTAALIANLDLVISVDTAVAHLAAALGKPVWLLDRFDPDWRWLVGRHDSPWYPSLRLYRQPKAGDWDSVLTEVVQDLSRLAKSKSLRADPSSIV